MSSLLYGGYFFLYWFKVGLVAPLYALLTGAPVCTLVELGSEESRRLVCLESAASRSDRRQPGLIRRHFDG